MDIRVAGHQVDVGGTLTTTIEERVQAIADKYFQRTISADVRMGRGPHDSGFTCEIIMHVPGGVVLKSTHAMQDAEQCFAGAADKIEKQLRRYGRRLKGHHNVPTAEAATQVVLEMDGAGYTVFGASKPDADEEEEAPDAPLIIAETRVDVPDASVGDAVMMLDLRHTNALLFKNSGTGAFNMVYRRDDGTIGWVEPARV